jgi:hypothetical protein
MLTVVFLACQLNLVHCAPSRDPCVYKARMTTAACLNERNK